MFIKDVLSRITASQVARWRTSRQTQPGPGVTAVGAYGYAPDEAMRGTKSCPRAGSRAEGSRYVRVSHAPTARRPSESRNETPPDSAAIQSCNCSVCIYERVRSAVCRVHRIARSAFIRLVLRVPPSIERTCVSGDLCKNLSIICRWQPKNET